MSEHTSIPAESKPSAPEDRAVNELHEPAEPRPPLTEERKQELMAFWRDVFSGKIQPEAIKIPPEVEAVVRAEEKKLPGPISAKYRRGWLERVTFSWNYGENVIVCYDTPAGSAVLVVGEDEYLFFLGWATVKQHNSARTVYSSSWEEVLFG